MFALQWCVWVGDGQDDEIQDAREGLTEMWCKDLKSMRKLAVQIPKERKEKADSKV